MADGGRSQIKQMVRLISGIFLSNNRLTKSIWQVNFILQEAHEKANEIMVKTEHDFK